jgi:hypothetical protein
MEWVPMILETPQNMEGILNDCIYIYIYIYRRNKNQTYKHRERERERLVSTCNNGYGGKKEAQSFATPILLAINMIIC